MGLLKNKFVLFVIYLKFSLLCACVFVSSGKETFYN